MSTSTCTSQYAYEGTQLDCTREQRHDGVHLGRITHDAHSGELVQWTDSESIDATTPVDELPIWYSALPIGMHATVETQNGYTYQNVQLTGAVLDDHEQLTALRLDYDSLEQVRHVLLPWSRVSAIEWGEQ